VLGDFLKRRIAPLKQRPRPAWNFTGLNDCSRTHRGQGSDLIQEALEVLVRAVTGEVFVPENLILPQGVVPLCENSRLRTAVLATLPTLDDGGLAARQTGGDPNCGLRIPGASGDQAISSAAGSGPTTKGKQAVTGSAATSGPSQVRSSPGALLLRLLRGVRGPLGARARVASGPPALAGPPRGPRRHHHPREIVPSGSSSSGSHRSSSNSNNRNNSGNIPGLRLRHRHGSSVSVVAGHPVLPG